MALLACVKPTNGPFFLITRRIPLPIQKGEATHGWCSLVFWRIFCLQKDATEKFLGPYTRVLTINNLGLR